jgi:hypothetical protein
MAYGKEITADKLEALGAGRVAELLAELSAADPVARKAVRFALAAGQSLAKLHPTSRRNCYRCPGWAGAACVPVIGWKSRSPSPATLLQRGMTQGRRAA